MRLDSGTAADRVLTTAHPLVFIGSLAFFGVSNRRTTTEIERCLNLRRRYGSDSLMTLVAAAWQPMLCAPGLENSLDSPCKPTLVGLLPLCGGTASAAYDILD